MFSKILVFIFLITSPALASIEDAERIFAEGKMSLKERRSLLIQLVKAGYYFSSAPWMKDYLTKTKGSLDNEMERTLDLMISHTGVKAFELLPLTILRKSRTGNISYIQAKKLFKQKKYTEALKLLSQVDPLDDAYPFSVHLKATILSGEGKHDQSISAFKDCIRYSQRKIKKTQNNFQKNQLKANRELCVAGISRVYFNKGDFTNSELSYLDIEKDSFVWPLILFEEAWTSYYLKNYNRTLGKLVSYKAPVFNFIFNPEVEVLKALTYLKMCLYGDAKKTADDFYNKYLNSSRELRRFLLSHKRDYRYFYQLMADHEEGKNLPLPILATLLSSIAKEPAFIEIKSALVSSIQEYKKLRTLNSSRLNLALFRNVKTQSEEYMESLGAYVRSGLVIHYADLYSAFQGMSYIKLEVLAQKKEKLYSTGNISGKKRGNVEYIERNDKQYFWDFNGEFWADELGDYVFALRSEC